MEDLVVTRDDITCAYIKVGAKGEDLISGRYKVQYCPTEWGGEGNLYVVNSVNGSDIWWNRRVVFL